jgi:hypothetical protein
VSLDPERMNKRFLELADLLTQARDPDGIPVVLPYLFVMGAEITEEEFDANFATIAEAMEQALASRS